MDRNAELPRVTWGGIASLGLALLSACSIGNPAVERQERATRLMACSLVMNTLSGARPAPEPAPNASYRFREVTPPPMNAYEASARALVAPGYL